MKKILCLTLSLLLTVSLLAGCRGGNNDDTTGNPQSTVPSTDHSTPSTDETGDSSQGSSTSGTTDATESVAMLSKIWEQFGEDERFAAYGGTVENAVDNAPGALDLSYTEELTTKYLLPQQHLDKVQEAASLVHMMNSNVFTSAVFRFADAGEVEAIGEDLYQNILNNQWICGSPDRLIIATIGDGALLMAFGSVDAMMVFSEKLNTAYPNAKLLQDVSIAS